MKQWDWVSYSKPVLFTVLLMPLMWLALLAIHNGLGPDPAKALVDQTGLWSYRLLLLCLAMTPLRQLLGQAFWIRYRRMAGLFVLFYVSCHFLIYVFLLFGAEWGALAKELTKRPYIIVGFTAFLMLIPLGITSTRNWQRRLGKKWVKLHKLVYVIGILGLLHFAWLKKLGFVQVWPYAVALVALFLCRFWYSRQRKSLFPVKTRVI